MKKIFLGCLALSLMSGTAVFANGGKKKSKAKTTKASACPKTCTETRCPMMGS